MKFLKYTMAVIFALTVNHLFAQTNGGVRGTILDKATGNPVAYAVVQLVGTQYGATSNETGFYSINNVPVGEYVMLVKLFGYDSLSMDVSIKRGGYVNKQILLSESGINLKEFEISAEREAAKTEVLVSKVTVTPKQIRALPSTGGEADIAQYLPVLPGVISTGDQGGQLYIRGGAPIQNKVLIDGLTIYNPFHSIGFFSVFETEAIRSVDVYTGGFGAQYGGRISAIVDIKTKDGNKKRLSGLISGSPFQSKVLLEGPISVLKESGGGSTSFILTGKTSYIDQTSKQLYKRVNNGNGLPFSYTDLYGKVSFNAANGSKVNLFGFNFLDKVKYQGIADLGWKATGGGASLSLIPGSASMLIGANLGYSDYAIDLKEADGAPRQSKINGFNLGLDFTSFGAHDEFRYGFDINNFNTDFAFTNFKKLNIKQEQFTTELSGFFSYKYKWPKLVIEPGLRVQYYASLSESSLEPRLGLKWNATDKLRFKLAGGMFSQNLLSTVSEQDIVNLFVGFLSGPEEQLLTKDEKSPADSKLQKAVHLITGVEYDVNKNLTINLEPYVKKFTQLINLNRNKTKFSDPNYESETGDAYGIDLSAKYDRRNFYAWVTYSLGFVNRDDGTQIYPTNFDRRHNVNLVATYNFGKDKTWEFGARWNFGTGFPFTRTQGFYEFFQFQDGVSTDVNSGNGDLGIIYSSKRNDGRLPTYHRLDLSLKKTIIFSKSSKLEINATATNAYDRANIFYFDRVRYSRVDQLPILPSIGLIFHF
ncbi:MAG TPA: TonB-dependent receptor [Saprospiraceae bacterium]|nr:TonB-dependent receptor [Saprospiraceae bacterium]HMZ72936.1 TonB-dependent receptor [Saprospiraceae bacterium]HNE66084.1 TonB-dependent receptor [Saprospiraceae bacterium]HNG06928.1 TonB-dependent receptor [Saprospiraceae bacterium]HNJ15688.1 TonB-dependent receptor [Saprospiraceae bacterium]